MQRKPSRFQDPQKRLGGVQNAQALALIAQPSLGATCRGHRGAVTGVSFQFSSATHRSASPAAGGSSPFLFGEAAPKVASSSTDGSVALWETKITHRSLRNTAHRCPVLCCDCSPKTLAVCSGGHNGYSQLWMPNTRRTHSTYAATWSLATGGVGEEEYCSWKSHSGATRAIAFARDGSDHVYTGGDDKAVKCWDLNYLSNECSAHASGGGNKFVGSFSTPSTSSLAGVVGHTNWIRCLAVQGPQTHSSYFHLIASGGDDRCAFLWDTRTQQCVDMMREPQESVRSLVFHPTGYAVGCGDATGAIHLYDIRRVKGPVTTLKRGVPGRSSHHLIQMYPTAHTGAVNALSFTNDGNWLLSAGDDGDIHVWDVVEGHLYCTLQAHTGAVKALAVSTCGQHFASGGFDQTVLVWRLNLPRAHTASRTPDEQPALRLVDDEGRRGSQTAVASQIPSAAAITEAGARTPEGLPSAIGGSPVPKQQQQPHAPFLAFSAAEVMDEDLVSSPPVARPATAIPKPTPVRVSLDEDETHRFRRSEERLEYPQGWGGALVAVHSPQEGGGAVLQGRTALVERRRGEGGESAVMVETLAQEQQRLREDLTELRRAVEQLTQPQTSLPQPSSADEEVRQLRQDMLHIQKTQQEEFQHLRALLSSWMASAAGAGDGTAEEED